MKNYNLEDNEVVLYEDDVIHSDFDDNVQLTLTSKKIIFEQEKGILKKKSEIVDIINFKEIKLYKDKIQVIQKGSEVNIQTINENIKITFSNLLKANKFVTKAIDAISGTTFTERSINKIKGAINTIDDVLEIDTRGTIKGVVENGIVGTILTGSKNKQIFNKTKK